MVDWPDFLTKHNIEFIEHGPSTSKGNIYVHCPMCGSDDQGHHLGISLYGKGWGCWRKSHHRGRSAVRLVMILLNVSHTRASEILGLGELTMESDDSLKSKLAQIMGPKSDPQPVKRTLRFPEEFNSLHEHLQTIFLDYLAERGWPRKIVFGISTRYKLHWALQGKWRYRLIFPVYTEDGLVTWTGRHVTPGHEPRYDTLTVDPGKAYEGKYYAKANIKDCLFNENWLYKVRGGRALIVTEGPFDAMRLDWNGWRDNVHSTCLFGKVPSETQIEKLHEIGQHYSKRYIMLDPDAELDFFPVLQRIKGAGFKPLRLVRYGVEDPGALSNDEAKEFIRKDILEIR